MPSQESVREHNARLARAREQASRDLHKSVRHVVTEVNEAALDPEASVDEKSLYATRHMVALLGRVALEQEKTRKMLAKLIWVMGAIAILLGAIASASLRPAPKEISMTTVSELDFRPKPAAPKTEFEK